MSVQLSWFRVELDNDGKVISCRIVSEPQRGNVHLQFVRADSEVSAGKAAFNAYYREIQRTKRARFEKEGKCKCGRPRDQEGFKQCSFCRAQTEASRARRKQGIPRPDLTETYARRRAEQFKTTRLAVLEEVRAAWRQAPNVGKFTAWLRSQIERAGGKDERDVA